MRPDRRRCVLILNVNIAGLENSRTNSTQSERINRIEPAPPWKRMGIVTRRTLRSGQNDGRDDKIGFQRNKQKKIIGNRTFRGWRRKRSVWGNMSKNGIVKMSFYDGSCLRLYGSDTKKITPLKFCFLGREGGGIIIRHASVCCTLKIIEQEMVIFVATSEVEMAPNKLLRRFEYRESSLEKEMWEHCSVQC